MDNIEIFPAAKPSEMEPDIFLQKATGKLQDVVIIGWEKDSDDFYLASSTPRLAEINWLLDIAKKRIMDMATEGDE